MKNLMGTNDQSSKQLFFVNFRNASPQAIEMVLRAMNTEVREAIAQKRIPTVEGAHRRLFSNDLCLQ